MSDNIQDFTDGKITKEQRNSRHKELSDEYKKITGMPVELMNV